MSGYSITVRSGERKYEVAEGEAADRCPHCGIRREFAGYQAASCGDDFRREGCFVAASSTQDGRVDP